MKISYYGIIAILLVVTTVALAGCSASKTIGTGSDSAAGTGSAVSSSSAPSAAATAAATCPAVTTATSWTGTWDAFASHNFCDDLRKAFYPSSTDNPDPWNGVRGNGVGITLPVTFTQTGCDVTGSAKIKENGCPITFTGTVDKTGALSGTWKAYCDISFESTSTSGNPTSDNGVFNLNMNPDGSGFIGEMMHNDPDSMQSKPKECPNGNSNIVGKRA